MEWIPDGEPVSTSNVTVGLALQLLAGLNKIHEAGVLHNDVWARNTLVVPGADKAIWLNFSCAHLNEEELCGEELEAAAAAGTIMWKLFDKAKREGLNLAISAYASYNPLARRVWALSYSFILACEGFGWVFGLHIFPSNACYSTLIQPLVDYGPLNIFTAVLLATDSSAIHLRTPLFHIAWLVKLFYPLFSAALSIKIVISQGASNLHHNWLVVRLLVTLSGFAHTLEN